MRAEASQAAKNAEAAPPKTSRFMTWHRRVLGFCLVVFALELGLPLIFVPWTRIWEINLFPINSTILARFWMSGFFRGALSGLGLLNVYIALAELARQLSSLFGQERE
jgi:hypothetical protein